MRLPWHSLCWRLSRWRWRFNPRRRYDPPPGGPRLSGVHQVENKGNVFEGKPDARQSDSVTEPVSRFRPRYRALTDDEKALHDALKNKAAEMEALYAKVKDGRNKSLALTELEASVMWIVKELTS